MVPEPTHERIAGRYLVKEPLGVGGMGRVDRVFDERTRRDVALKRPIVPASSSVDRELMFEREYQTLVELAHPRIIEVYDYGRCDTGRYYTMELLRGRQLLDELPLAWREVCVVLRDVASALALLHSRRQLHRDVSARNVYYEPDGRAKLIDFGALVAMGTAPAVVGTPPHLPPEALHGQPLDARADLYSLGALAYHALTGRHAYPTQQLSQLRSAWQSSVPDPSQLVLEVPEELSRLVMSLLALDRLTRPSSAAEVMERLTAIGRLPPDESPAVATAYLTTPRLIGREAELQRFRRSLTRAAGGEGSASAIAGPSGVGRTRLLASFRLDARTLGASALHVDGCDGTAYCTVRRLVAGLIDSHPELEAHRHLSPSGVLHALIGPAEAERSPMDRRAAQSEAIESAVSELVEELAVRGLVLLTVDDFHLCDPPSALVLVRLAQQAEGTRLRFVATFDESASQLPIVQLLATRMRCDRLAVFDTSQTKALLGSLFGDVPQLQQTAEWAFSVSNGSPGLIMQLAQHLVDHGLASYESGGWSLARDLPDQALPGSLAEAWAARIDALSGDGQTLAAGLALCFRNHPLPARGQARLLGAGDDSIQDRLRSHQAFTELQAYGLLRTHGDAVRFAHPRLVSLLRDRLDAERRKELHRRLLQAFRDSRDPHPLVLAHHAHEAGGEVSCLERTRLYLSQSADTGDDAGRDFALEAWCFERALATARRLGRPRTVTSPLLLHLLSLAHRHDRSLARYFDQAIAQASVDIGLHHRAAVSAELGPNADPSAVIQACQRRQAAERATTSSDELGLSPEQAADALARSAHRMAAVLLETLDADAVEPLPAVVEPVASLSPALAGVHELALIIRNHIWGLRHEDARTHLIARWRRPVQGLPDGARTGTVRICTAYHGWFRAECGATDGLRAAQELEAIPAYEALGWDVRFGVQLYQGNTHAANEARERRDVALATNSGSLSGHCLASTYHEVRANALSGDLIGVKRALRLLEAPAAAFPAWRAIRCWGRAEYYRLRGELIKARSELEAALAEVRPGRNRIWCWVASTYTEVLLVLGDNERAVSFSREALARCDRLELAAHLACWVRSSAALALAAAGDERGSPLAELALNALLAEGGGGLPLARLLENRARVAHALGDREACEASLLRLHALTREIENAGLAARFQTLSRVLVPGEGRSIPLLSPHNEARRRIAALSTAVPDEAFALALRLLLEDLEQAAGFLFAWSDGAYRCVASQGGSASPELIEALADFMQTQTSNPDEATASAASSDWVHGADDRANCISCTDGCYAFYPLRFVGDGKLWISAVLAASIGDGPTLYSALEHDIAKELARLEVVETILAAG